MSYYFAKTLDTTFDDAVARATADRKKAGFGVLTEIDVKATLKEKLNVDFRRYRILGACNPPFAYKALQAEDWIGLLMPCNVVVQERPGGTIEVAAVDPLASMSAVDSPALRDVAGEVREKLRSVVDSL